MKFVHLFFLIILINACTPTKNRCFDTFGSHIYWNPYFAVKFDNKFKGSKPMFCEKYGDGNSLFTVTARILDEKIRVIDGNTAGIMFSTINFVDTRNNEKINALIDMFSKEFIFKVNNINNNRFEKIYAKNSKTVFSNNNSVLCRIVATSVKDYKATNIPKNKDYLIQNDIYKICFLKDYNQFMILTISYRIVPELEKMFWIDDVVKNLNHFSLNIIMKDGKRLYDVIAINKSEIVNLINKR